MNTETTAVISDMEVAQIDRSQAVALTVSFSRIGDKREGNMDEVSTSADKDMTKIVKKLFASASSDSAKCAEFDAIRKFDSVTYIEVQRQTVPLLGRRNVRLLKADAVQSIDQYLTTRSRERQGLVTAFVKVYPAIILAAQAKLGQQYSASDYKDVEQVEGKFCMTWDYLALGVPDNLPDAVRAVVAEKAEKQWMEAASDIRDGLRQGMADLVDHLVSRLNAKDTDKKARFHDSNIGNVLEFIDALEKRDMTNDVALKAVADKARALIIDASPKDIRDRADSRKDMIGKMAEVKAATDSLLAPVKGRKFRLAD